MSSMDSNDTRGGIKIHCPGERAAAPNFCANRAEASQSSHRGLSHGLAQQVYNMSLMCLSTFPRWHNTHANGIDRASQAL
eukprot:4988975-Amphidinium_carterae.2